MRLSAPRSMRPSAFMTSTWRTRVMVKRRPRPSPRRLPRRLPRRRTSRRLYLNVWWKVVRREPFCLLGRFFLTHRSLFWWWPTLARINDDFLTTLFYSLFSFISHLHFRLSISSLFFFFFLLFFFRYLLLILISLGFQKFFVWYHQLVLSDLYELRLDCVCAQYEPCTQSQYRRWYHPNGSIDRMTGRRGKIAESNGIGDSKVVRMSRVFLFFFIFFSCYVHVTRRRKLWSLPPFYLLVLRLSPSLPSPLLSYPISSSTLVSCTLLETSVI